MSNTLRTHAIRIASDLPVGDPTRRQILLALQRKESHWIEDIADFDEIMSYLGKKIRFALQDIKGEIAELREREDRIERAWSKWDLNILVDDGVLSLKDAAQLKNIWKAQQKGDEESMDRQLRNLRGAYDRGTRVEVRDLPPGIQKALKSLKYGRKDIQVQAEAHPDLTDFSGDGQRAFATVVDILTGHVFDSFMGSWGGPNIFSQKPLDKPDMKYALKPGQAVIHGSMGGRTYVSIYYHPSNKDTFVPETETVNLSSEERKALTIFGYKSSYRSNEWWRSDLPGKYSLDNPLIQGLLAKGLIKVNQAGAIALTTSGRNLT